MRKDALFSVRGAVGQDYKIKRILQEKDVPPRSVYLATLVKLYLILYSTRSFDIIETAQTTRFKDITPSDFGYLKDMYSKIDTCSFLRLPQDSIPEKSMFVYRYFTDHLLGLAQENLPLLMTKRILRDSLCGLADLHSRNIVHTDVKPNNILINRIGVPGSLDVKEVQLGDLEDAALVPAGSDILGRQVGNLMWRSPEAHAEGRVNKPSDMFSFGITCIYAVYRRIIFAVNKDEVSEDEDLLSVILERQISYFAEEEGLRGLLEHLGESPWVEVFQVLRDGFNKENPRKPFRLWQGVDPDFKDLVRGLTEFDPAKRLTADAALAHKWFM